MDAGALVSKLNKIAPKSILEKQRFGRSDALCVWIENKAIRALANGLISDSQFPFDWLENVSVMHMEDALVVTYFLRSSKTKDFLVLRSSVDLPKEPDRLLELPSVRDIWRMAEPMEAEAEELFGLRFVLPEEIRESGKARRFEKLPEGWSGFPLRKNYVFPGEFGGISRVRKEAKTEGSA